MCCTLSNYIFSKSQLSALKIKSNFLINFPTKLNLLVNLRVELINYVTFANSDKVLF